MNQETIDEIDEIISNLLTAVANYSGDEKEYVRLLKMTKLFVNKAIDNVLEEHDKDISQIN